MRVCVLGESPADDAALSILVSAVLGCEIEPIAPRSLSSRGWPAALGTFGPTYKELTYNTDAGGLVQVVDSDLSPAHEETHEQAGQEDARCRLCQLRLTLLPLRSWSPPGAGRRPLRVALGLAVPSVEAWLLFAKDHRVGEALWSTAWPKESRTGAVRELKSVLYDTDRPTLQREMERMTREATRLVAERRLAALETHFPAGFGHLARELRQWTKRPGFADMRSASAFIASADRARGPSAPSHTRCRRPSRFPWRRPAGPRSQSRMP